MEEAAEMVESTPAEPLSRRRIDWRTGKETVCDPRSFWEDHERRRAASGLDKRATIRTFLNDELKMIVTHDEIVPPKEARALIVRRGQRFRITDLEGQQVVDVALFNADNYREKLSLSYSVTRYALQQAAAARGETLPEEFMSRDYLTEGDILMSTIFSPMMTFVRDTPNPKGVHKVNQRMCNRRFYESFGVFGKDGCHEAISRVVAPYGLRPEDIPDTIDFFMNYHHDCARRTWVAEAPVSRAGDYVELRAEMDCLVGLSNCPEDTIGPINGYRCTPIRLQVFEPPDVRSQERTT